MYFAHGRVVPDAESENGYCFEYTIQDHLGNNRVFFSDKNHDGILQKPEEILKESHYYPFGMDMDGDWVGSMRPPEGFGPEYLNRFNYNGKEFTDELGIVMYDYGARWYDAAVGRFSSVDPLASDFPSWNNYHYVYNNPMRFTDPTGMSADDIIVTSKDGTELFTLDDGKKEITTMTAQEAYKQGIQWFEPEADNFMELIGISEGASSDKLKHFTLSDIENFANIDRPMLAYRSGGSGDWKANKKPGDGYLLVTIDNSPYWADAVGQIPFAANKYRNEIKKKDGTMNKAIQNTLKAGQKYGDGNIISPTADNSSQYDNLMILRGALWQAGMQSLIDPVSPSNARKYGL